MAWRAAHLHEADAAGQEVHEEGEERAHVVDLRGLGDAAQRLQRGHDLLLDGLLLADLGKVLLVDEVEEALLQGMEHLRPTEHSHTSSSAELLLLVFTLLTGGDLTWFCYDV